MMGHVDFMRRAIELGHECTCAGDGGPFGAVVVKDGVIVGEGRNKVTTENDPTAHAEVVAIRDACVRLGTFDLSGARIYTSCEPCPMCLGAILWARIERLFYAADRTDAARVGFDDDLFYVEVAKPIDDRSLPAECLMREEALVVLDAWLADPDRVEY